MRLQTAWLEAQQGFAFKAQPITMCAYEVDCADVLDLTDSGAFAATRDTLSDLGCAWEDIAARGDMPPSWALAQRLMASGCAGFVVPSFASKATRADINALFWGWAPNPPHQVRVIDDHGRLPKHDSSWR